MHGCLALLPQSQAVDEKMPLAQNTWVYVAPDGSGGAPVCGNNG